MKSIACISSSVRTACLVKLNSSALMRGAFQKYTSPLRNQNPIQTDPCRVTLNQQCVNVRSFRAEPEKRAVAHQVKNEENDYEDLTVQLERSLVQKEMVPVTTSFSGLKEPQKLEVLHVLSSHLKDSNKSISNKSIDSIVILLGECINRGVDPLNSVILAFKEELQEHLVNGEMTVSQLCRFGEVVYNLDCRNSELLTLIVSTLHLMIDSDLTSSEAAQMYAFLSLIGNPRQSQGLLTKLHRHTERLVHRLQAGAVIEILHSLTILQQNKAIGLALKLSKRATRFVSSFQDKDLIKVLGAFKYYGQYDQSFVAAMEKYVPGRVLVADPELVSAVAEYCLQVRCRSEPILEAVAEGFVFNGENYSTSQISRLVVALGRLNYLPECSPQMFTKLEGVLSSRFSQFQARHLLEMLHACIHLQRFPLNFMPKVFNNYFLLRLEAEEKGLDRTVLGQLNQLSLSTTLECFSYQGPSLPYRYRVKKFSSLENSFESPMDRHLFSKVKGPLKELLGEPNYFMTSVFTQNGYTVDVEMSLDENGFIIPLSHWEQTHTRMALFVDGPERFCMNTQHLLGKEATKRRHLQQLGYEVVQVPYFEFEKLKMQKEKVQYLHQKIFPKTLGLQRRNLRHQEAGETEYKSDGTVQKDI
ncbi:hypothetical protein JZ751_023679 [Albula glossodonta]|uniref:RAP domain-containing protein n=1 Tax=Albula glossodonta TaxID=121402 RepID=A0A8T2NIJ4_9TELE|nr:hypothetical protein JZ751_023679 [Albula glossodonta]